MTIRFKMSLIPSALNTSLIHALPAGGTTTNFFRPSQKTTVARNIIAAGIPNAHLGPKRGLLSRTGQNQIEIDEPQLIAR